MSGPEQRELPKQKCENELPPIPYDNILPKFEIPELSCDISPDSQVVVSLPFPFSNPLLGVPVDLCDLSKYSHSTTENDIERLDLEIAPELQITTTQKLQITQNVTTPVKEIKREQVHEQVKPSYNYSRSTFFDSPDDKEIQEQLHCAFGEHVPEGKIYTISSGPSMCTMSILGAQPLKLTELIHLMAHGGQFLKSIEKGGGDPVHAYYVETKNVDHFFLKVDKEKQTASIRPISTNYRLKLMNNKDMKENQMTARFVQLDTEPSKAEER